MKTARLILTYVVIALVAIICAVCYQFFVFPNQFAPAGLNGICTMIQHLSGISMGYLSLIINIPLAIWVWFRVGHSMATRSMVYVTVFSVALILLGYLDLSALVYDTPNGTSRILGPLVAGVINGACFCLLTGCSANTGGTDFIAALIHRTRPDFSFFWITFILNVSVAVGSYFVYDFQLEPVILCILYCFMRTTVSDRMFRNERSAIRCEIVTDNPDELFRDIAKELRHGATLIPATGMYSGKQTNILVCIVNKPQLSALISIVNRYPHSFAVLCDVGEVMGNFKHLDNKGRLEKHLLDQGDSVLH